MADQLGEDDLPDDPLGRKPTGERGAPKRETAELLPSLNGTLTEKVKSAVDAIRNALHNSGLAHRADIPVVFNESVDRHIRSFTGPKRDSFSQWLVRAKKYEPTIRRILAKNGLPEDLVYVAMIESGFNMKACSRANAMGPWQFMYETGRQYGLRVDYWVDERYDLEKSTVAAARYLKKLFDQFGCWYLVAASYNAGENRVKKAMENGKTKDFWELREYNMLPQETQEYVPQLIAAAIIAKDPQMYGFDSSRSTAVYRLKKLTVPGGVPLKDIAKAFSVDLADLRALNPELLQGIIPPDAKRYQINLPRSQTFLSQAKRNSTWDRKVVQVLPHMVRAKDTVKTIERRYRVGQAELSLVNADGLRMEEGKIIYIPRFSTGGNKARTKLALSHSGVAGKKTSSQQVRTTPSGKLVAFKPQPKEQSASRQKVSPTVKACRAAEKKNTAKSRTRKMARLDNH